jgi:hypothetical protein
MPAIARGYPHVYLLVQYFGFENKASSKPSDSNPLETAHIAT